MQKNENFGEVGNPLPTVPTFQKKKNPTARPPNAHCTSAQRRPSAVRLSAGPPVIRPKSPNVRLVEKILSQQYQQSNIPKQKKKTHCTSTQRHPSTVRPSAGPPVHP